MRSRGSLLEANSACVPSLRSASAGDLGRSCASDVRLYSRGLGTHVVEYSVFARGFILRFWNLAPERLAGRAPISSGDPGESKRRLDCVPRRRFNRRVSALAYFKSDRALAAEQHGDCPAPRSRRGRPVRLRRRASGVSADRRPSTCSRCTESSPEIFDGYNCGDGGCRLFLDPVRRTQLRQSRDLICRGSH